MCIDNNDDGLFPKTFFREHDKDPESFFNVLNWLHEENFDFWVSVIGQSFSEIPGNYSNV